MESKLYYVFRTCQDRWFEDYQEAKELFDYTYFEDCLESYGGFPW